MTIIPFRGNDIAIGPETVGVGRVPSRQSIYKRYVKRALDVIVVLIASVPVLTVVLPIALLVALDGKAPFYVQERVGRQGRIFRMWKLRTMVQDADRILARYLEENPSARREWELHQKLKHDPRITPIGNILRKTSLDELPQLWNVLKGDMSLVGPRPMMPSQQAIYPGSEYFAMRPGITGFWQISVRNESSFAERASYDKNYFHELSFNTDLKILGRTVGVVLGAKGC